VRLFFILGLWLNGAAAFSSVVSKPTTLPKLSLYVVTDKMQLTPKNILKAKVRKNARSDVILRLTVDKQVQSTQSRFNKNYLGQKQLLLYNKKLISESIIEDKLNKTTMDIAGLSKEEADNFALTIKHYHNLK
jgi:preprotein translocase subunit SecD